MSPASVCRRVTENRVSSIVWISTPRGRVFYRHLSHLPDIPFVRLSSETPHNNRAMALPSPLYITQTDEVS
jgi:hypothetical protein